MRAKIASNSASDTRNAKCRLRTGSPPLSMKSRLTPFAVFTTRNGPNAIGASSAEDVGDEARGDVLVVRMHDGVIEFDGHGREYGRARARRQGSAFLEIRMAIAGDEMVIDHAHRLHECIHNRRPHELEAALLQLFGDRAVRAPSPPGSARPVSAD